MRQVDRITENGEKCGQVNRYAPHTSDPYHEEDCYLFKDGELQSEMLKIMESLRESPLLYRCLSTVAWEEHDHKMGKIYENFTMVDQIVDSMIYERQKDLAILISEEVGITSYNSSGLPELRCREFPTRF
jgi:hypothetical protein